VLGLVLQFVDRADGSVLAVSSSILVGFPLAKVLSCFEVAAVAGLGHADGLKWLLRS
jgi:hypothetical protein